jgi:hypothetical protein
MANDRRMYEVAVDKWSQLQKDGLYSAPIQDGVVAIVASNYPYNYLRYQDDGDFDPAKAHKEDDFDIYEFNNEAIQLVEELGMVGLTTELLTNADFSDVRNAVRDREISDMIFIGHGALAGIFLEGAKNDFFDWKQASEISTHLKTGYVTQRQCGIQPRDFNPALGMFLVKDITRVRAARGILFEPKGITCPANESIQPIFDINAPPDYRWLKLEFQDEDDEEREFLDD